MKNLKQLFLTMVLLGVVIGSLQAMDGRKEPVGIAMGARARKIWNKRALALMPLPKWYEQKLLEVQTVGGDINTLFSSGDCNDLKETLLAAACRKNDKAAVEALLIRGANPDVTSLYEYENLTYGPLHVACKEGNGRIVYLLLRAGANVNLRDSHKDTPLHFFCSCQEDYYCDSSNMHDITDEERKEIMPLLLAHKDINPNCGNDIGRTPLGDAAYYGEIVAVQCLLRCKSVDVEVECTHPIDTYKEVTPLYLAEEEGCDDISSLLREYGACEPDFSDEESSSYEEDCVGSGGGEG